MNGSKIRVFIFNEQSLLQAGLEHALSLVDDLEVSGAAEINDELLSTMDNLPPDVAIIDIDVSGGNGLAIARKLKRLLPNIGIVALTSNCSDMQLFKALKAQVAACLNKDITFDRLIDTVRRVAHGEHPINEALITHPILADQVLIQFQEMSRQTEVREVISTLTRREKEILNYLAQGCSNKQIAYKLGISEQTTKNHVTSILRKLNANARTEAVIMAIKQGLVTVQ